jgi:hypothetical protein
MKFHTSAVIQCREPSRVARMLEEALRDITIEVIRSEERMTLVGLGPGAVSMSKDDRTVLTLEEREGAVFVAADGDFDGSYLGQSSTQQAEVCCKLERVFQAVQDRIDLEEGRKPVERALVEMGAATNADSLEAETPARHIAPVPVPLAVAMARKPLFVDSALLDEVRMHRATDVVPANYRQAGFFAATVIGFGMMAAAIDGIQTLVHRNVTNTPEASSQVDVPQAVPAKSLATLPLPMTHQATVNAAGDSIAGFSTSASRPSDMSADPVIWLSHWEQAMRTRDAAEQSSFYADPVERYQGQVHMSNAAIEQKKRAAIAGRKGLWTMKVDEFVIEKQTEDTVEIRLVKHFINEPAPAHISEQFVQTQLRLARVNDAWKIVLEEDLEESPNPLDLRS